ncbi:uncharacterized protein PRCAT00000395001 [Priceomyces carsonii]|uniref:uncharacterized protein n=1 Tax=Priceomyces carsonii TaxID=28549 RepID=UPI002ED79471|nr:unnamed protein product [Priceomyces carsonii]
MVRHPIKVSNKKLVLDLIQNNDNFLFDCDGVIWLDNKLIPGVLGTLNYLKSMKKNCIFITNNSSKSRLDYVSKFQSLGVNDVGLDNIYPTSYAIALYVRDVLKLPKGSKIWILGEKGIEIELKELGYVPLGGTDKRLDVPFDTSNELLSIDPEVKAVVVGSTKDLNYMRISLTLLYLLHENKSLPFIGANIDRSYPGPHGLTLPAGGCVVKFMEYAADRVAENIGKPSTVFLDTILKSRGFDRQRTLMIGDTLYTDIKFGNDGNLGSGKGTLLVFTGGTKKEAFEHLLSKEDKDKETESGIPSFYMDSLDDIVRIIEEY